MKSEAAVNKVMNPTQKKHKFNAIDAAVIILIAAIIVTASIFLFSRNEPDAPIAQTAKIEYVVELRTIRDEFADNFGIGDSVTDANSLAKIGQVVAISVNDATYAGVNLATGESVSSDYPDHSDVALTVSANATMDGLGRYVIGAGYDISVGKLIYVRTPNYIGYGYCTELRQIEGGAQ